MTTIIRGPMKWSRPGETRRLKITINGSVQGAAKQLKVNSRPAGSAGANGGLAMRHWKARILGLILILISAFLIHINWHQLSSDGQYSIKMAAFGPVIGVGGLFLLIFPSMAGKPTTARDKIIVVAVLGIGMLAGLINW